MNESTEKEAILTNLLREVEDSVPADSPAASPPGPMDDEIIDLGEDFDFDGFQVVRREFFAHIITQKVSNVSKDMDEITICSRLLAAHNPPIGIYFISEDIFTLASYYREDLHDTEFLPGEDWQLLPDESEQGELSDG